jgi:hypothetical protein
MADKREEMLKWLEDELKIETKWKIVYLHYPLYCSLYINSKLSSCYEKARIQREYLEGIFTKNGVHLVISGHNNTYEYVRKEAAGGPENFKGTVYLVCGTAGNKKGHNLFGGHSFIRNKKIDLKMMEMEIRMKEMELYIKRMEMHIKDLEFNMEKMEMNMEQKEINMVDIKALKQTADDVENKMNMNESDHKIESLIVGKDTRQMNKNRSKNNKIEIGRREGMEREREEGKKTKKVEINKNKHMERKRQKRKDTEGVIKVENTKKNKNIERKKMKNIEAVEIQKDEDRKKKREKLKILEEKRETEIEKEKEMQIKKLDMMKSVMNLKAIELKKIRDEMDTKDLDMKNEIELMMDIQKLQEEYTKIKAFNIYVKQFSKATGYCEFDIDSEKIAVRFNGIDYESGDVDQQESKEFTELDYFEIKNHR